MTGETPDPDEAATDPRTPPSGSDVAAVDVDLDALPAIPRDEDGPVFAEPWQAEAFAMAVRLHEQGVFTWRRWAETLGEEIRAAQEAGDPDLGDTYYEHWVRALSRIVAEHGAVSGEELEARTDRWRRAYLATPHGHPVELSAADE